MVDPGIRHTNRRLRQVDATSRRVLTLHQLNPSFDLPYVLKVVVQPGAVDRTEVALEVGDLTQNCIKDTRVGTPTTGSLFRRRTVTEQALENHAWVALHRQRSCRRRP